MNWYRILLLSWCFIPIGCAQTAATPAKTQTTDTRKTSTPYTGDLTIFDSPGRADRLQIDRVMDLLEIGPGKNVADVGAGSGWFTILAAKRVRDAGTVYAVDINPEAIHYIEDRVQKGAAAQRQYHPRPRGRSPATRR